MGLKFFPYTIALPMLSGQPDEVKFWWADRMEWVKLNVRGPYSFVIINAGVQFAPGPPHDPVTIGPAINQTALFSFEQATDATLFKLTWGGEPTYGAP